MEKELFLPRGDGQVLQAEAYQRAIASLPLEDCVMQRNELSRAVDFVAPPGKAFVIRGDNLRTSRFKIGGSRDEADAPLEPDPHTLNHIGAGRDEEVREHFATRLSLMNSYEQPYGRHYDEENDEWTTMPPSGSSDERIHVALLDPPQAWTATYMQPYTWTSHNHPLARRNREWITVPQNVIGMRQGFVHGDIQAVEIELVDIDPERLQPKDGRVRSADGRALQIASAGEPGSENKSLLVIQDDEANTAAQKDAWNLEYKIYYPEVEDLPYEERLQNLWQSRRNVIGQPNRGSTFGPFADDPLGHLDFVLADQETGEVISIERAIEYIHDEVNFGDMLPRELDEETKKAKLDPKRFASHAHGYVEPVQRFGSMAVAIETHCTEDWQLRSGQVKDSALFGQYDLPHTTERVMADLSSMSMSEIVEEFASAHWRQDDISKYRIPTHPRRPHNDEEWY